MDDFTFEYAGKTFECYIESRGLLWGHATLEPPGEPEKSPRWHYRVNGGGGASRTCGLTRLFTRRGQRDHQTVL